MKARQAAALGAVQGLAEVVPVSSSAQLVLVPWLLGWDPPEQRTAFAAGLHAGSCLGIAWVLRPGIGACLTSLVVSVPAAAAGAVAAGPVEDRLGRPGQLAALMAGAAALLLWADRRGTGGRLDRSARGAAALAQPAALLPGISRSGATLTALRLREVPRERAVAESLLLSLPLSAGAAALSLTRSRRSLPDLLRPLAVGAPVAAVTSAAAARLVLRRPGTVVPASSTYRLGLAAVVTARLLSRKAGS